MGQTGYKNCANEREWKLAKQAASNCYKTFAAEIKKVKKEKEGITANNIRSWLKCSANFLGCFAEDELQNLSVSSFPSFLIVNIDPSNLAGSHWIAIGIFSERIEIFDSLGFDLFNWSRIPCTLINFLNRLAVTRKVLTAPRIQSSKSHLCGFYAIYYVIMRNFTSFEKTYSCFCKNFSRNDRILTNFFKNDE